MDSITGGTIPTDGVVNFAVDSGKTGYIQTPDGNIYPTGGDGTASFIYTGISGKINFYIPKTSVKGDLYIVETGATPIRGEITTTHPGITTYACQLLEGLVAPYATGVNCHTNTILTKLIAPVAVTILATNAALSAKSIGDILYSAYVDNRQNIVYTFTGGNNALQSEVNSYLLSTYGITYTTVFALLDVTGTILIDTI